VRALAKARELLAASPVTHELTRQTL
jgi:hypothetical protein